MRQRWTILVLVVFLSSLFASQITKFTDTSPKTVIKTYYSETQMKGKKNVEIFTNFDRPYQVFLSGLISTRIDAPYKIVNIINSAPKIVGASKNGQTLVLTLQEQSFTGNGPNIHVILENGKSLLINTEVLSRDQSTKANEIISFIDIKQQIETIKKDSKEYYMEEVNTLKSKVFKIENYIQGMLNKPLKRQTIDETIYINNKRTSLTLLNITRLDTVYLFHLIEKGDPIDITPSNTILEFKPIKQSLTQELFDITPKFEKQSEKPFDIYYYQSETIYQREITLYFNIASPKDLFYFNLVIWPDFQFNNRNKVIDFNQVEIENGIFEDF